ncbi:MAG: hypothetical protein EBQ97_04560 [Bacteroidetes bacterium]|nr:hypothetical protein [Bacteroidota bacterium]
MNRAKSITDIGDIYREMQRVRAAKNLNESVITEAAKVKAKMPKDTFPKSSDVVKEPSTLKKGGPQNVKGLNKAKKNKKFSQKSKKIVKEDINSFMSIFDRLYEDVMKNDELDINTGIGMGPEGSAGDSDSLDFDTDSDSDLGGDEVTITLDKDLAKKLLDVLKDVVGDDDEDMSDSDTDLEDLGVDSEDMGDDMGDDEDEDNEGFYETTDIQKLPDAAGHKLTKGMDAAGNIKKNSGKADARVTDTVGTETGKHPFDHKSELTNPSKNKVGGLKAGKSLFDQ